MRADSRLAATLILLLAAPAELAGGSAPTEHEVKAAFLYNFAKFVKWPDEATRGSRFVVAILGEDPFGDVVDKTFAGKTLLEKPIEIRRCKTVEAAKDAQILFIGSSPGGTLDDLLRSVGDAGILTVGETKGFTDHGGMIGFRLNDGTVRFEINLRQAERAGLKVSSQLIRLAQRVITTGGGA